MDRIEHDGNGMPVGGDVFVYVEHGDGWVSERPYRARAWRWAGTAGHGGKYDIIAYWVVKP